jgi:hypothetical protein
VLNLHKFAHNECCTTSHTSSVVYRGFKKLSSLKIKIAIAIACTANGTTDRQTERSLP